MAERRSAARAGRDFATADRLKADIEAAGWRVIDRGDRFRLEPGHPADAHIAGRTRYGWSGAVPSLLDRPAEAPASVILVATEAPDDLERSLASLAGTVDDAVQRIVVANGPSAEQETVLMSWQERWAEDPPAEDAPPRAEVVWLASRLGAAAALNAGIRRAASDIVVLLDASIEALGDVATPLAEALAEPSLAVAGPWGLVSDDQRHFSAAAGAAAADGAQVAAIDLALLAFRRSDYRERGPLDERFESPALLGAWWSLVLRDDHADGGGATGAGFRRAVVVDVPAARRDVEARRADDDPAERRNRYRLIDRFGRREDLAVPG